LLLFNVGRVWRVEGGQDGGMETSSVAEQRVRELERLLAMERARRQAVEQGLERLSARCTSLARQNAALRELVPDGATLPEPV
jgi:hypothetical protein